MKNEMLAKSLLLTMALLPFGANAQLAGALAGAQILGSIDKATVGEKGTDFTMSPDSQVIFGWLPASCAAQPLRLQVDRPAQGPDNLGAVLVDSMRSGEIVRISVSGCQPLNTVLIKPSSVLLFPSPD